MTKRQGVRSIMNRRAISANPTIVLSDFGESRQLLAGVAKERRAADRVVHTKLALPLEDIS
jgi:hypothetical protein